MQPGTHGEIRPPRRHPTVSTTAADGSSLRSISDPLLVFQKAFWRRPENEDIMLHAERREWSTKVDGVRHWQWFIACRLGPKMLDWLDTHPFSLSRSEVAADSGFPSSIAAQGPVPAWFPPDHKGSEIRGSGSGNPEWIIGAGLKTALRHGFRGRI
jgi:hypothetical protein